MGPSTPPGWIYGAVGNEDILCWWLWLKSTRSTGVGVEWYEDEMLGKPVLQTGCSLEDSGEYRG